MVGLGLICLACAVEQLVVSPPQLSLRHPGPSVHFLLLSKPARAGEVIRPTASNPDAIVPGLMAAGEASSASVHGANRLGANSLLDIVVFGRACALRTAETLKPGTPHKPLPADAGAATIARLDKIRWGGGGEEAGGVGRGVGGWSGIDVGALVEGLLRVGWCLIWMVHLLLLLLLLPPPPPPLQARQGQPHDRVDPARHAAHHAEQCRRVPHPGDAGRGREPHRRLRGEARGACVCVRVCESECVCAWGWGAGGERFGAICELHKCRSAGEPVAAWCARRGWTRTAVDAPPVLLHTRPPCRPPARCCRRTSSWRTAAWCGTPT